MTVRHDGCCKSCWFCWLRPMGSLQHRFGYTSSLRCTHGIHLSNGSCPPFSLRGAGMWVRLTRRLADCIDGVNLSAHQVGDVFEVTRQEAELLVAEAWAVFAASKEGPFRPRPPDPVNRANVDRRQLGPLVERLRTLTKHITHRTFQHQDRRRAEDRIRDEWHDAHARVINGVDTSC